MASLCLLESESHCPAALKWGFSILNCQMERDGGQGRARIKQMQWCGTSRRGRRKALCLSISQAGFS